MSGKVNPLSLKPAPETAAAVMVTSEPPVFFKVTVCDAAPPTTTLPKLILVGLTVTSPAGTPVPVSGRFTVPLSVAKAILPLTAPSVVGANCTLKAGLSPGVRVNGAVMPVMLNPVPVTVICEIVRADWPVLVTAAALA